MKRLSIQCCVGYARRICLIDHNAIAVVRCSNFVCFWHLQNGIVD